MTDQSRKNYLNSILNIVLYLVLGIILICYGMNLWAGNEPALFEKTAGAFIVVLLLLLILAIVIRKKENVFSNPKWKNILLVIEVVAFLILTFAGAELRIQSVLNAQNIGITDQYQIYETAVLIGQGSMTSQSAKLLSLLIFEPAYYGASVFASFIMLLFGYRVSVLLFANVIFSMLTAVAAYFVARILTNRSAAMLVYAVLTLLPSAIYSVGIICPEHLEACLIMLTFLAFFGAVKSDQLKMPVYLPVLLYVISALTAAICVFFNPVAVIIPIGEILYLCFLWTRPQQKKMILAGMGRALIVIISLCIFFAVLLFCKNSHLNANIVDTSTGYYDYFLYESELTNAVNEVKQSDVENGQYQGFVGSIMKNIAYVWGTDSYADHYFLYHMPYENQIFYGIIILSSFIYMIFAWLRKDKDTYILLIYLAGVFAFTAFAGRNQLQHFTVIPVFVILMGKMFWHFMKRADENEEQWNDIELSSNDSVDNENDMPEEVGVITIDMLPDEAPMDKNIVISKKEEKEEKQEKQEDIIEDEIINKAEPKKERHYLENPLPTPKKHVAKELDFDYEVNEDDDYDYEIDDSDDYDQK